MRTSVIKLDNTDGLQFHINTMTWKLLTERNIQHLQKQGEAIRSEAEEMSYLFLQESFHM